MRRGRAVLVVTVRMHTVDTVSTPVTAIAVVAAGAVVAALTTRGNADGDDFSHKTAFTQEQAAKTSLAR